MGAFAEKKKTHMHLMSEEKPEVGRTILVQKKRTFIDPLDSVPFTYMFRVEGNGDKRTYVESCGEEYMEMWEDDIDRWIYLEDLDKVLNPGGVDRRQTQYFKVSCHPKCYFILADHVPTAQEAEDYLHSHGKEASGIYDVRSFTDGEANYMVEFMPEHYEIVEGVLTKEMQCTKDEGDMER